MFPREPIMTVRAPAIEAQLVETYLLLALNHQSPHRHEGKPHRPRRARAARCWNSAPAGRRGRTRRSSARARPTSAGCTGTACTLSDQLYGVPAGGTMAHSWVQMFDSRV